VASPWLTTRDKKRLSRRQNLVAYDLIVRTACIWTTILFCIIGFNFLLGVFTPDSVYHAPVITNVMGNGNGNGNVNGKGGALELCHHRYGNLSYVDPSKVDYTQDSGIPPLLLSFPGSGNTYLRAVLEYATGLHSGSTYLNDQELNSIFAGERSCSRDLSVVKAHPADLFLSKEVDIWNREAAKGDKRVKLRPTSRWIRKKCGHGKIKFFDRIVFLAREPFAAILSDFQRVASKSHTGTVSIDSVQQDGKLVKDVWLELALKSAQSYEFAMNNVVSQLFRQPNTFATTTTLVRFEEIIKDKKKRVTELRKLMGQVWPTLDSSNERLECAFMLADRRAGILRSGVAKLSPKSAYVDADPKLVCGMWKYLSSFAHNFSFTASPNPAFASIESQCGSD